MAFDEIAPLLDRSPPSARQLASRARRRVRDGALVPDPDLVAQRSVVEAFFAAASSGDLDALIAVLDPDVVGAQAVAIDIFNDRDLVPRVVHTCS